MILSHLPLISLEKSIPNTSNSKLYRELMSLMTEQANSPRMEQGSGRTTSHQELIGHVMGLLIALALWVNMELMYEPFRKDLS